MAVETTWDVGHSCGHPQAHDLSAKRVKQRAGYARWLATKDCSDCWHAERERQTNHQRDRWIAARQAEECAEVEAWEALEGMGVFDFGPIDGLGSPSAPGPARRCLRHPWLGRCGVRRLDRSSGPADQGGVVVDRPARLGGHRSGRAVQRRRLQLRWDCHAEPALMARHPDHQRLERTAAGLRRSAHDAGVELPVSYSQRIAADGLGFGRSSLSAVSVWVWSSTPTRGRRIERPLSWVRCAAGVGVRDAIALLDSRTPLANAWAGHGNPTTAPERLGWAGAVVPTEAAKLPEGPDLARTPPERVYAALGAAWRYYTYRPLHELGLAYLAGQT
jgi:hypothetical protein